jgi:hypothetical protein
MIASLHGEVLQQIMKAWLSRLAVSVCGYLSLRLSAANTGLVNEFNCTRTWLCVKML